MKRELADLTLKRADQHHQHHRTSGCVHFDITYTSNFGCDLEMVEVRSPAFVEDYCTADEQAFIADISLPERFLLLALLWSAKESALKALRVGLRLDTRCMSVKPSRVGHGLDADLTVWHPLSIRYSSTQAFSGWWRLETDLVRTVVSDGLLQAPFPAPEASLESPFAKKPRKPFRDDNTLLRPYRWRGIRLTVPAVS